MISYRSLVTVALLAVGSGAIGIAGDTSLPSVSLVDPQGITQTEPAERMQLQPATDYEVWRPDGAGGWKRLRGHELQASEAGCYEWRNRRGEALRRFAPAGLDPSKCDDVALTSTDSTTAPTTTLAPPAPVTAEPVTSTTGPTTPSTSTSTSTTSTTTSTTTGPSITEPPAPSTTSTAPPRSDATFETIESEFDASPFLNEVPIAEDTSWEPSGSFRFFCAPSHVAWDDPIVAPGENVGHLHLFFGNTAADRDSTWQSLRSGGDGTCQGGALNRTAYWMPAMLDGDGEVVVPEWVQFYYKGNGSRSQIRDVQAFPNGFRYITGWNAGAYWNDAGNVAGGNKGYELPEWSGCGASGGTIPANCEDGEQFTVEVKWPYCWDGISLGISGNHRGHMAYGEGGTGWYLEEQGCPATHPVHLPEVTMFVRYESDGDTARWRLSSDDQYDTRPGESFHADWFGAWDPHVQDTWLNSCIREMRSCSWGDLGNGTQLDNAPTTFRRASTVPQPQPGTTVSVRR